MKVVCDRLHVRVEVPVPPQFEEVGGAVLQWGFEIALQPSSEADAPFPVVDHFRNGVVREVLGLPWNRETEDAAAPASVAAGTSGETIGLLHESLPIRTRR